MWKEELLKAKPGWWLYVRDFPYQGITLVLENDSSRGESAPLVCTIKNKRGDELFSFTWGLDFQTGAGVMFLPDGNGIFRSRYSSNSRDCYAELLSWDGTLIGQIDNLCEITIDSKATPDKKFMILYDGSTAVIVKNGKEVCRKKFVLNLSDDGKFICFGDTLKMHTYHVGTLENGGLLYTFLFAPSNTGMINCAFSSNNKYLAAFSPSELILIDNETGKQLWKRKVDGDAYKRKVFFANNDKHIVLAYLGRVYIFDLGGNLLKTINEPNSNNWQVYNDILIIDIRDDHILHKVIYKSK